MKIASTVVALLVFEGCVGQVADMSGGDDELRHRKPSSMQVDSGAPVDLAAPPTGDLAHPTPPSCGNGIADPGEACDGTDLSGFSCAGSFSGFVGGTLSCKPDCSGFVTSACVAGRTIRAASCSVADVSTAIGGAADGDTVVVPSGTCTWSSALTVTKGIALIGAGAESGTTLINGTGGNMVTLRPSRNQPMRLSGIRFDQHNTEAMYGVIVAGLATHVRIDHTWFETGDWAIAWNPFLASYGGITGTANGVIDHSTFHNMKRALAPGDVRMSDRGGPDGNTAWTEPMRPGTIHNMYVEDNQFLYDAAYPSSAYASGGDSTIYGNPSGGSVAVRYNNFSGYNWQYLDSHGDVGGATSGRLFEIYQNTFTYGNYGSGGGYTNVGDARGGSWIVWGNRMNGYPSGHFELWNYCANYGHTVENTYFWDNRYDGTLTTNVAWTASHPVCPMPPPVLDRDYFFHVPEAGQTFSSYVPFVYPHPLATNP